VHRLACRIKVVLAVNGERLPMLIGPDGSPMFEPTVFSLSQIRARNRAANKTARFRKSDWAKGEFEEYSSTYTPKRHL
jgi:hypothetical protein